MEVKKFCKNCHYSRELGALESGKVNANGEQSYVCRRFPPTPIPVPAQDFQGNTVLGIQGVHPPVRSEDSCGEFIKRAELATGNG